MKKEEQIEHFSDYVMKRRGHTFVLMHFVCILPEHHSLVHHIKQQNTI